MKKQVRKSLKFGNKPIKNFCSDLELIDKDFDDYSEEDIIETRVKKNDTQDYSTGQDY